jgi:hypothetical protein
VRRSPVVSVLVAVVGCTRAQQALELQPDVALFYSADLRGAVESPLRGAGGLARRATWVDRGRLTARAVVQVDAGDIAPAVGDGPDLADEAGRESRARLALRAYRRMGVDAVTIGEREIALGVVKWRAWCSEMKVPVVSANVVGDDGKTLFPSEIVIRAGDVAVGVFGVLDLGVEPWPVPAGVAVTDPLVAARGAVRSLRAQGARVIIGLFHVATGVGRAREIAAAAPGVDVVVLGHAGPSASPRFVRAGERGVDVGRIDLRVGAPTLQRIEDRHLASSPDVPEQLGVHLLERVARGPIAATFAESVAALSKTTGGRTASENWTYATSSLCAACHPSQAAQWKTTSHAQAYATLTLAGKDHDPSCMGCHMTGFLSPGGAQNFESALQFVDVGCEACHGPSTAHVVSMNKRRGTSRSVDPLVCLGCHVPEQNGGTFAVAAAFKQIIGPGHGLPPARPR